jgi:hypothetical protein
VNEVICRLILTKVTSRIAGCVVTQGEQIYMLRTGRERVHLNDVDEETGDLRDVRSFVVPAFWLSSVIDSDKARLAGMLSEYVVSNSSS